MILTREMAMVLFAYCVGFLANQAWKAWKARR